MFFDFDAEAEAADAPAPGRQTRCYAVTGEAEVLAGVEALLRRIEGIGKEGVMRLVSALVDGRGGATVTVRVLASWVEEPCEHECGDQEGGSG